MIVKGYEINPLANLRGADLCGAYLCGANLCGANLCGADLRGTNLRGANLCDADLCGADLCGAYLCGADLRGAYLCGADLCGTDLRGANLRGAIIQTGESWEAYLAEVVPALLTAGGRPLAEVATPEHWECHAWDNCPMSAAFNVTSLMKLPMLHYPRAVQFIQFFDSGLIPLPTL